MVCYANNICTSIYDFIYVYSCIECGFWGGGGLFKKLIDTYLLRNKKKNMKKRMLQLNFMLCSFKLFLLNQCFICNSYENVDSDEIIF